MNTLNNLVTLLEMLEQSAATYGEKTALQVYRGGVCARLSYADLLSSVRSSAAGLI
ncbi:MAG: hypothetical protein HY709_08975, partial [Candidatus Latescibacteria bacterium]|nr:hypothetical protein [Candidatus Latescibacterota bacterium]